jgi:UPF0271 protein
MKAVGGGSEIHHVKPHGALYNNAAVDPALASAIAEAVRHFSSDLVLYCLPGSEMEIAANDRGIKVAREGFVDRRYEPNGLLVDRRHQDALVREPADAAKQALALAVGSVAAVDGSTLALSIDTLCLHGDTKRAAEFARAVSETLRGSGFRLEAV